MIGERKRKRRQGRKKKRLKIAAWDVQVCVHKNRKMKKEIPFFFTKSDCGLRMEMARLVTSFDIFEAICNSELVNFHPQERDIGVVHAGWGGRT
jgi:hypothetical protein